MSSTKKPVFEEVKPTEMEATFEKWTKKNINVVYGVLGAIILIPLLWFGYQEFVAKPKAKEAASAMFMAENYFALDSFNLALNGNAEFSGFLTIIDDFGGTPSGNLAKYYAGVCHFNLGQYQEGIDVMKGFKTDDAILYAIGQGIIGDCYSELNDFEEAVSYYEKAASKNQNSLSTPVYLRKAAQLYESEIKDLDKAIKFYNRVVTEFPTSSEADNCLKYLERAKASKGE